MVTKIWVLVFMAAAFVAEASERQKEVNGVVVSKESGEVLELVVVWVKGTHRGMVTGQDGQFDLQVNEGDTLEFSANGNKTYELVVGDGSLYKAELELSEQALSKNLSQGYALDPWKSKKQD